MIPRVESRVSRTLALLVLAAGGALVGGTGACASVPDETRFTNIIAPSQAEFVGTADAAGVSLFMERRCGSLDCHGQPGRPLRIYSARGLRLPPPNDNTAANVPGGAVTTPDEQMANYQSVIALEPEVMSRVVAASGDLPERLMLLRKPLQSERHKGGPVIVLGDAGYLCLSNWLAGAPASAQCTTAAGP